MKSERVAQTIEKLRAQALKEIRETRIAGKDTRHSRATNLHAIRELVRGHPHYTFGIKGVERFSEREVLDAISGITKCSNDPNYTEGGGYISPESTLKGLEMGAKAIASAARRGGKFVVATGHPGSLLLFYIEIVRLIREWGGEVLEVERGAFVPPNFDLDYVEGVAVVSDRCSIFHSHDTVPMEVILRASGPIDAVVSDHGFAGAAVNAGVPVVGIVDTNDPALAVAKRMGANVVIIPMDDNRPLSAYSVAADIIREFGNLKDTELAADGKTASWEGKNETNAEEMRQKKARPKLRAEAVEADRMVSEKLGPQEPLDQMVQDLLKGFKDHFLETHFSVDDPTVNNPYVILAIYRQVLNAVERFVAGEARQYQLDLSQEELDFYLGRVRQG